MKLGDIFVSTALSSGSGATPQAQPNINITASAAAKFNSDLQQFKTARRDAIVKSAQTEEKKSQNDSLILRLNQGLERAQLDLVGELARIDNLNREEEEKNDSDVYLNRNVTAAEFEFQDFYNKTQEDDPDNLFAATHTFINSQLNKLRKNAPNEKALIDIEKWGTQFKAKALGKAVADRKQIKLLRNAQDIEDTNKALAVGIFQGKADLDQSLDKLRISKENLKGLGATKQDIDKTIKKFGLQLVNAKIDNLLSNLSNNEKKGLSQIAEAEALVDAHKDLYNDPVTKLQEVSKSKESYLKLQEENTKMLVAQHKLAQKELTDFDSKEERELAGKAIEMQLPKLVEINENNMVESIDKIRAINDGTGYVKIPQVQEYISRAFQGDNPYAAYAVIQGIKSSENNKKLFDQLDERQTAMFNTVDVLGRHFTSIPDAVNKAKEMMNPANEVVKLRTAELQKNYDSHNKVYDGFESEPANEGFFFNPDDIEGKAQYNRTYPIMAKLTGDHDVAAKAANQIVNKFKYKSDTNKGMQYKNLAGEIITKGTSTEKFPPDALFGDHHAERVNSYINRQLKESFGDDIDIEKRQMKIGSNEAIPFAIKHIPYKTEQAIKAGKPIPYQLVNGTPGYEGSTLGTIFIPTNLRDIVKTEETKEKPTKIPLDLLTYTPVGPLREKLFEILQDREMFTVADQKINILDEKKKSSNRSDKANDLLGKIGK